MSEIGISIHFLSKEGTDGVRTRDLRFTRPTPYHLATAPIDIRCLRCSLLFSTSEMK